MAKHTGGGQVTFVPRELRILGITALPGMTNLPSEIEDETINFVAFSSCFRAIKHGLILTRLCVSNRLQRAELYALIFSLTGILAGIYCEIMLQQRCHTLKRTQIFTIQPGIVSAYRRWFALLCDFNNRPPHELPLQTAPKVPTPKPARRNNRTLNRVPYISIPTSTTSCQITHS